jgi:hypothetical protein
LKRIVSSIFIVTLAAASMGQTLRFPDPAVHRLETVSTGCDTVLSLGRSFIVPGSDSVFVDSAALQRWRDYTVRETAGEIRFTRPPDSGKVIRIRFRSVPLKLETSMRLFTVSAPDTAGKTGRPAAIPLSGRGRAQSAGDDFADNLQKSGSIFRGVSLGTDQGMRLQSGLRLQVSGRIAPDVEVVASLTDQNTPLQPEGNTQTLQEIDKVFVEIKAPHFRATLGDFQFQAPASSLAAYSRKLQGATGTAEGSLGSVTVFAAASRGEFTTSHFNGTEGNQGPYQLTGAGGTLEIIVLAGTEKVWMDGRLLTRGEDNDYVIEYATGQVTFTRKCLVTAESRITIDFEYSGRQYQRQMMGAAGAMAAWKDRIRLRGAFLSESDDKDNPLDLTITDTYRTVLRSAGDSADSALVTGAKYVGTGKGSYSETDSLGNTVYLYRGFGSGDWSVHFSYVGPAKGDYSFQGYDIYRYEGPGKGAYLPVVFLPLASGQQLADAGATFEPVPGVVLDGEVAISNLDLNLFSGRDDGDNTGKAATGRLSVSERGLKVGGLGLGRIAFDGRLRQTDEAFRPLGRTEEVEHGRKWGASEGVTWGERSAEFSATYLPVRRMTLNGGFGSFSRGEFRSERKSASAAWSGSAAGDPLFRYAAEWIDSRTGPGTTGVWLRQNGSGQGPWKTLNPSVTYEGEHRRNSTPDSTATGFRFDEWAGKLAFVRKSLRLEAGSSVRDDRVYSRGVLERNSLAVTDRFGLEARTDGGLTSSVIFTHRTRDYAGASAEDQKTDLAEARLGFSPGSRIVSADVNYRFSSTQVSEMATDTIRIGAGLGNYRYDESLGEYVPDMDGDILFRTIQTGRFTPVNAIESEADVKFDASKKWRKARGFRGFLGGFQTRSLARIERKDRERSFGTVNRKAFNPVWGTDSTTVSGIMSLLQDLEYSTRGAGLNVRLRLRKDDSENRLLLNEGQVRRASGSGVRLKASPSRSVGLLVEVERSSEIKDYDQGLRQDRDIRIDAATAEASYRPRQDIELALKVKGRIADDEEPDPVTSARSLFFMPRMTFSLKTRGQFRLELEAGDVSVEPKGRTLPYEMLAGDQPGRTVRVSGLMTYRLSGHATATFSYRARREPWRPKTFHAGQVEVRAFF